MLLSPELKLPSKFAISREVCFTLLASQTARWVEQQHAWVASQGLRHQMLVEEEERRSSLAAVERRSIVELHARMRWEAVGLHVAFPCPSFTCYLCDANDSTNSIGDTTIYTCTSTMILIVHYFYRAPRIDTLLLSATTISFTELAIWNER